jgi:glyoxylase-like metal-dependent hydrolase (beta-lactamase superfamily II)
VATARFDATNSAIVVDGAGRTLLVDPAATAAEVEDLAREIEDRGWRVVAGFATHPHWDHLLWSPALGEVPRWARRGTLAAAAERRADLVAEATGALGEAPQHDLLAGLAVLDGDAVPDFPGVRVVGHEAHAPGHAALLVADAGVLLAGDMLSDVEVPLLHLDAADPVADYRTGLERLAAPIESGAVEVVFPGHGSVAAAAEARRRVALDRAYLEDLIAGRRSADPRLRAAPGWLLAAHAAQTRAAVPR